MPRSAQWPESVLVAPSSLVEQRRLQVAFADETANKIQRAVLWGQADNLMMVPTGCDQRSERQGWTGDSGVTADEASLNYDMGRFCKPLRAVVPAVSELTHPRCRLVRRPLVAAPAQRVIPQRRSALHRPRAAGRGQPAGGAVLRRQLGQRLPYRRLGPAQVPRRHLRRSLLAGPQALHGQRDPPGHGQPHARPAQHVRVVW